MAAITVANIMLALVAVYAIAAAAIPHVVIGSAAIVGTCCR
jgi:hypothetical protein